MKQKALESGQLFRIELRTLQVYVYRCMYTGLIQQLLPPTSIATHLQTFSFISSKVKMNKLALQWWKTMLSLIQQFHLSTKRTFFLLVHKTRFFVSKKQSTES